MLLDPNGLVLGLFLFDKSSVFLLLLILSILGAARKITSCARSDRVPASIIWTSVMVILVGALVFISTALNLLPQPSFEWLR